MIAGAKRKQAQAIAMRPMPPPELLGWKSSFVPDKSLFDWVQKHIIANDGVIHNPDHSHLSDASIGFLWTNVENNRQMRSVVGQAEVPMYQGTAWQKARMLYQLEQWFDYVPDFVITLDAAYSGLCTDAEFCALVEHELYHCAQKVDQYGAPKFNKETGRPSFGIRGHDVEEFTGVVRRYGVGSVDGPLASMIIAAAKGPEVSAVDISRICGTCLAKNAA